MTDQSTSLEITPTYNYIYIYHPDLGLHLKINNAEIPKVTAATFLGIAIDDRLNWKPHIQSVKSKYSNILPIIYKASKLITTAGMYTLYCSLF